MDIEKLRYFAAVSKTENLRKASEILHVSPSTLSKALKSLEDSLRVPLVTPFGRGIVLTAQGKAFAERIETILLQVESLKEEMSQSLKQSAEGPLTIATFEVFSTYFLGTLPAMDWKERGLVLHEAMPGEIERAVESKAVDFGISYLPVPYPQVEHIKVTSIRMGVYRKKGRFEDIKQSDLPFVIPVHPLSGAPTRIRGLDGWPEDAYTRKIQFEVTLMESALELCRQGRCAGYFPSFVIQEHNRKHLAEFHLIQHPSIYPNRVCYSDVYLVKRKDTAENKDMKLLARMIRMGTKLGNT